MIDTMGIKNRLDEYFIVASHEDVGIQRELLSELLEGDIPTLLQTVRDLKTENAELMEHIHGICKACKHSPFNPSCVRCVNEDKRFWVWKGSKEQ